MPFLIGSFLKDQSLRYSSHQMMKPAITHPTAHTYSFWHNLLNLRSNLKLYLVNLAASEIHYAFRGRLVRLLVLTHCGVSLMPFLPQESPCIASAGPAFTTISYSSARTKN